MTDVADGSRQENGRMTRRRVVTLVASLTVLAGCAGTPDQAKSEPASVVTSASPIDAEQQKRIEELLKDSDIPPVPSDENAVAYLTDLERINPELVEDRDRAALINRGRDQCTTIKEWPGDEGKWAWWANQRFTTPEHPDGLGDTTARKIVKAVRKWICPTY